MKKVTLTLLGLCLSASVVAAKPTNWHRISILNQSNHTVWYVIDQNNGAPYGIENNDTDTYTTKRNDSDGITIKTGKCNKIAARKPFNVCSSPEMGINCVNDQYYMADKIQSITVTTFSSCTVTCSDGTNNSCKKS